MKYLMKKALMEKHWKKNIRISKILETKIVIQKKDDTSTSDIAPSGSYPQSNNLPSLPV